jgi:ATP-dependent protease ClpP protease subunit
MATKRRRVCEEDEIDVAEDDEESQDKLVRVQGNNVYFYAEVMPASVLRLQMALQRLVPELWATGATCLNLYVMSPGGSLEAGLGAHDLVSQTDLWVNTIVVGSASSAAHLIAMAGHTRIMCRNAQILVHQHSHVWAGSSSEMQDEAANSRAIGDRITKLYTDRTNMSQRAVKEMLSNERSVFAEEAVRLGLVDEIWE